MAAILFLAFIGVPLVEIAVFIKVGGWIGLWPTLAIIILTAFLGTTLLRRQGLATLARAQQEMAAGRMPVRELFDGVCVLAAGALLLTPGFVTDALGLALFIPAVRRTVGRWLWSILAKHGHVRAHVRRTGPETIEATYEEVQDPPRRHAGGRH
jgi:UPF0716 protein FxsA